MIRRFTGIAARYYSYRWLWMLASALVFLTFAAIFYGYPRGVMVATLFAGPALTIAWGMALICFWFEPMRGSLYGGAIIRRLPRAGEVSRRLAVVFLVLWFLFGVLVWPALILLI